MKNIFSKIRLIRPKEERSLMEKDKIYEALVYVEGFGWMLPIGVIFLFIVWILKKDSYVSIASWLLVYSLAMFVKYSHRALKGLYEKIKTLENKGIT